MRALGFFVLLLCVVLGIGLYLGWFTVSASSKDGSRPNVNVSIDQDKMRDDVTSMKDKVSSLATSKTVSGTVRRVQPGELTVSGAQSHDITVKITPTTEIKIGDRSGTIDDIKADDPVSVVYEVGKDENLARKVSISRRS